MRSAHPVRRIGLFAGAVAVGLGVGAVFADQRSLGVVGPAVAVAFALLTGAAKQASP